MYIHMKCAYYILYGVYRVHCMHVCTYVRTHTYICIIIYVIVSEDGVLCSSEGVLCNSEGVYVRTYFMY